jgi:hypothetical protein
MGLHLKFIDYDSRNAMEFYTRKMYTSSLPEILSSGTQIGNKNYESYRSKDQITRAITY